MSKVKCIIIEDDPAFQAIIRSLVSKIEELEILNIFDNSVDAALHITRQKPELVFLDIEINGLNGLEVLDSLEHRPKTIVVTGENKYLEEASDLQVDAFITKPITSFEHFKQTVLEVINKN